MDMSKVFIVSNGDYDDCRVYRLEYYGTDNMDGLRFKGIIEDITKRLLKVDYYVNSSNVVKVLVAEFAFSAIDFSSCSHEDIDKVITDLK
jgi:hypothetical protein